MPRKSNLGKDKDRRFRVRIKFAVPRGGIRRLTEIETWLTARFGASGYAVLPVYWEGRMDAFAVHMDDPRSADAVRKYVEEAMANPHGDKSVLEWWYDDTPGAAES